MNLKLTKEEPPSWERKAFVWERVKQNVEKKEKQYVFKVLLFPLSTEAETTTARNKESALIDNGEKGEKGLGLQLAGVL